MAAAAESPTVSAPHMLDVNVLLSDLLAAYGPQHWWPASSQFEIAVGAVLVQRTAWRNAQIAIDALRRHDLLDPTRLADSSLTVLVELVRPAGFAQAKSTYLQALASFVSENAGLEALGRNPTAKLRAELLAVRGIGPETADSILLYLFNRPVWVVDAYATRVFSRISGETYETDRQKLLMQVWVDACRTADLQELHAVIVAHAKLHCRSKPHCEDCPLGAACAFFRGSKIGG